MGLCVSSTGAAAAAEPRRATALVLLPTGEMREYPRHATAVRALEEAAAEGAGGGKQKEGWFLCDADGMGYEGPVSAVRGDEELRAGQIYFVLPAEARRRGLRREEVAALAVRASAALAKVAAASGNGRRKRGAVAPLLFSPPPEEENETAVAAHKTAPPAGKRCARRTHRRFASDLTAIPECEISV
ncbi:hypothetical protein EJB05_14383, partial [Eragrostis curvula]